MCRKKKRRNATCILRLKIQVSRITGWWDVWFPCEDEKLSKVFGDVGIRISKEMNSFICGSDDKDFNGVIKDKYCNLDELNFITKRLDSLDAREKCTFYAAAIATGADSMEDLINLTYNTQCYSVINDFSSLNEVGKYVYLNEAGGASTKELEELDGKAIVENLMKFSPMKAVTSYGVVYQNRIEPEIMYDEKHFPCYHWQNEIATLKLEVKGERVASASLFFEGLTSREIADRQGVRQNAVWKSIQGAIETLKKFFV